MNDPTPLARAVAGAIIVAAGSSQRMGGRDKLLQPLDGRPLIAYAIAAFAAASSIDRIAVVASEANIDAIRAIAGQLAPEAAVVTGGARRQDSVRAGLDALGEVEFVLVHDGARPLVNAALIDAALDGARDHGAAICAVPVADTIKKAADDGSIAATIAREGLWLAQTPQAFRRDLLLRAHDATTEDATDDAALVERLGGSVWLAAGSSGNIKVTTPEDIHLAEALLRATARRAGAKIA